LLIVDSLQFVSGFVYSRHRFASVLSAVVLLSVIPFVYKHVDLQHIISKNQTRFRSANVHAGWVNYLQLVTLTS